jgi:hypothetical protein
MEKKVKRAIRFLDKKIVMKPLEGKGLVETWSSTPPTDETFTQYIHHKGIIYYLISSIDKTQPATS